MLAILLSLLPALGFGSQSIFVRLGLRDVKPTTGTALSMVSSILVVVIAALIFERNALTDLAPIAFVWLFAAGTLNFPVARLLNYTSVTMIGATRSSTIVSSQPIFAAALAILFLGERPNWAIGLGTFVIVVAVGLVSSEAQGNPLRPTRLDRSFLLGCLVALSAAMVYAFVDVIYKEVVDEHAPPLVGVTYALLFGGIGTTALVARDLGSLPRTPMRSALFLSLAGFSGAFGVTTLLFALSRARVVVVAPLMSISPLVTLVLAHLFLQRLERISWRVVVGTLLVVTGVIFVIFGRA